jgi:hypothetical protein
MTGRSSVARLVVDTNGADNPNLFELYWDNELDALPEPEWLVGGILPSRALVLLIGERDAFKSFAALDLAGHIANGKDWHGRRARVGFVLYVYAEGSTGLKKRKNAWIAAHNMDSMGVLFLPQSVITNDGGEVQRLIESIEKKLAGRQVDLIILDTLNRNSTGNENSSEDMSAIIRGCDRLREATGATVLLVHHKGHGAEDRGRGSSVLDAAADTIIFASRDAERLTLECTKQKDAARFEMLAFDAIETAGSLVLKPGGVAGGDLKGNRLEILRVLHENSTDNGLAYTTWRDLTSLASKASSFNKARTWLQANRFITTQGGKWKTTEAGRFAMNSTQLHHNSTAPSGVGGINSTPPRGGYIAPSGGVDEVRA